MKPFLLNSKTIFTSTFKNINRKFKFLEKKYTVFYGEFLEFNICYDCANSPKEALNLSSRILNTSRPQAPTPTKA